MNTDEKTKRKTQKMKKFMYTVDMYVCEQNWMVSKFFKS